MCFVTFFLLLFFLRMCNQIFFSLSSGKFLQCSPYCCRCHCHRCRHRCAAASAALPQPTAVAANAAAADAAALCSNAAAATLPLPPLPPSAAAAFDCCVSKPKLQAYFRQCCRRRRCGRCYRYLLQRLSYNMWLEEWGEQACRPYHGWVHRRVSTLPSLGGN